MPQCVRAARCSLSVSSHSSEQAHFPGWGEPSHTLCTPAARLRPCKDRLPRYFRAPRHQTNGVRQACRAGMRPLAAPGSAPRREPVLTFTRGTIPFSRVAADSYSGANRLQCPHLEARKGVRPAGCPSRPAPGPPPPAAPHQGAKNSTSTSPGRSARPLSKSASLSSTTSEARAQRASSRNSSSAAGKAGCGGRGADIAAGAAGAARPAVRERRGRERQLRERRGRSRKSGPRIRICRVAAPDWPERHGAHASGAGSPRWSRPASWPPVLCAARAAAGAGRGCVRPRPAVRSPRTELCRADHCRCPFPGAAEAPRGRALPRALSVSWSCADPMDGCALTPPWPPWPYRAVPVTRAQHMPHDSARLAAGSPAGFTAAPHFPPPPLPLRP